MSDVDDLLQKTSRTFAITIPILPAPTRHEVGVAYLLFRIIDTFEDAKLWPPIRRVETIWELMPLIDEPASDRARELADRCAADPPVDHAGYLELLRELPFVLGELDRLSDVSRHIVRAHLKRSAEGMADIVSRAVPGHDVKLSSIDELRHYCYVVAGIVGEMLTELFLLNRPSLAGVGETLRERSRLFGEGLQLVNILKDASADASENRIYIPRAARAEVFVLAQADLRAATEYTLALQNQGAERGLVAFNALLVRLARGTLAAVRDRGPGSKLSRVEVLAIMAAVLGAVDNGRPALPADGSDAYVPAAE